MISSEKRETLMRSFTRLQEYAIQRERRIQMEAKSVKQYTESELVQKDFYTQSVRLPYELFKIEVLYNLGRAFHQVGILEGKRSLGRLSMLIKFF